MSTRPIKTVYYRHDTGIDYVAMRWTKAGVLEVVEKLDTYHPTVK